ncbi:hypothetical protein MAR_003440, partial [Mya arenaria]
QGCNQVTVGVEYSVSTLGECRRTTGCQTFGIRNSTVGLRCKCASNIHVHSGTCRRKCEEADQYPCGDIFDTNMFSIYAVENDGTSQLPATTTRESQPTYSVSTTTQVTISKGGTSRISTITTRETESSYLRGMLRTCFKNTVIEKTTAEVSTAVANQQRVEYVNTTSDGMHRNTKDTRDAQTYEKLNMTTSSDNYLSIQEIDADRHFYQNT